MLQESNNYWYNDRQIGKVMGNFMQTREKWILETKKGDFDGLAGRLGVSPLVVRCMINRGVAEEEDMRRYLQGTVADLHDPLMMKDVEKAVHILIQAKEQGA